MCIFVCVNVGAHVHSVCVEDREQPPVSSLTFCFLCGRTPCFISMYAVLTGLLASGITDTPQHAFYVYSRDFDSGPNAWVARALPTQQSPAHIVLNSKKPLLEGFATQSRDFKRILSVLEDSHSGRFL